MLIYKQLARCQALEIIPGNYSFSLPELQLVLQVFLHLSPTTLQKLLLKRYEHTLEGQMSLPHAKTNQIRN